MIIIKQQLKEIGSKIYKVYMGIGIVAMGILACCIIFSVIMRYCFSLSWKELEEFMTTLFAFTTFWGMGICVMQEEHVVIDAFYDLIPPKIKKYVTIVNYIIVLIVDVQLYYFSINYVMQAGNQISLGMGIPMYYMYGIMPVCYVIAAICIFVKMIQAIMAPIEAYEAKNKPIKD